MTLPPAMPGGGAPPVAAPEWLEPALAPFCHPECPQRVDLSIALDEEWRDEQAEAVPFAQPPFPERPPRTTTSRGLDDPPPELRCDVDTMRQEGDWYRLSPTRPWLASRAPGRRRCGTDMPGWLQLGEMPEAGAPPARGVVCFANGADLCFVRVDIALCRCSYDEGATSVPYYWLPPPPLCAAAYCTSADEGRRSNRHCAHGEGRLMPDGIPQRCSAEPAPARPLNWAQAVGNVARPAQAEARAVGNHGNLDRLQCRERYHYGKEDDSLDYSSCVPSHIPVTRAAMSDESAFQFDDDGCQEWGVPPGSAGAVACLRTKAEVRKEVEAAGWRAANAVPPEYSTPRPETPYVPSWRSLAGLPDIEVAIDARGRPLASARASDRWQRPSERELEGTRPLDRPPLWRDVKSSSYDGSALRESG